MDAMQPITEPEASVPAVMRSYHEVLRNDLTKVLAPLADAGEAAAFAAAWRDYCAAAAVHAAMEDGVAGAGGGMAAMLDTCFPGAGCAAVIQTEHEREHAARQRVSRAVSQALTGDAGVLRHAYAAYRALAEDHLQHEEDVMMPLVTRLPAPLAPMFAAWCLSAGLAHGEPADFDHYVAHGAQMLSTWGSGRNTPAGAARVWLQALKALCTPAQWARCMPLARRAAAPGVWAAMLDDVPSLQDLPTAMA